MNTALMNYKVIISDAEIYFHPIMIAFRSGGAAIKG